MKQKTWSLLLLFTVLSSSTSQGSDFFDTWQNMKKKALIVGLRIQYYAPYVIVPAVSAALDKGLGSHKVGFACVAGWAAYSTLAGAHTIHKIKHNYRLKQSAHGWFSVHDSERNYFSFARWRQRAENNGTYFWVTAWQMQEDKEQVKRQFLEDLSQNKIMLKDAQSNHVVFPMPYQVFAALERELGELERNKQRLKNLTDVYYAYGQPEAFAPDNSWFTLLWPNYNEACQVYIDLDCMMKRLETLKAIIVELGIAEHGYSWPIAVFQKYGISIASRA